MISKILDNGGRKEWRAHWPVVITIMFGMAVSQINMFVLGVSIEPLQNEFDWTRAQVMSGILVSSIIMVPFSPVMGVIIDRFGPRRVAILGTAFYCLALACLALASKPIWTWWLLWAFLSIGRLCLAPMVWIVTISSLFTASRGMAIAVTTTASGIGSIITPLLTVILINEFGWRQTFVIWGMGSAAITLPLMYFFFFAAADKRKKTDKIAVPKPAEPVSGSTLLDHLRNPTLYKLSLIALLITLTTIALALNIVPILRESGIDAVTAASIAAVFGISQLLARLGCGYLLDRMDARKIGAVIVAIPIISSLLLLTYDGSIPLAIVAMLALGVAVGGEVDLLGYLGSRYFSGQHLGALFGVIIAMTTLATGVGPVLTNHVYDITQSYDLVLWATIPLLALSSVLVLALGPVPLRPQATD